MRGAEDGDQTSLHRSKDICGSGNDHQIVHGPADNGISAENENIMRLVVFSNDDIASKNDSIVAPRGKSVAVVGLKVVVSGRGRGERRRGGGRGLFSLGGGGRGRLF